MVFTTVCKGVFRAVVFGCMYGSAMFGYFVIFTFHIFIISHAAIYDTMNFNHKYTYVCWLGRFPLS